MPQAAWGTPLNAVTPSHYHSHPLPIHHLRTILSGMGKRASTGKSAAKQDDAAPAPAPPTPSGKPSALLDTRVVYCGDNLEQLAKLPDGCVDLIYIDYMRPRCVELARVLPETDAFAAGKSAARLRPPRIQLGKRTRATVVSDPAITWGGCAYA